MEWQPIETAKSGVCIVFDTKKGVIYEAYLDARQKTATYGFHNNSAYHVTHWMPLPPPPKT